MSANTNAYYAESAKLAFESIGVDPQLTEAQWRAIGEGIAGSAENYSTASGLDVVMPHNPLAETLRVERADRANDKKTDNAEIDRLKERLHDAYRENSRLQDELGKARRAA